MIEKLNKYAEENGITGLSVKNKQILDMKEGKNLVPEYVTRPQVDTTKTITNIDELSAQAEHLLMKVPTKPGEYFNIQTKIRDLNSDITTTVRKISNLNTEINNKIGISLFDWTEGYLPTYEELVKSLNIPEQLKKISKYMPEL